MRYWGFVIPNYLLLGFCHPRLIAAAVLISQTVCYWGFLGDLKESPSLGESSHVTFSRMAKYSSLTILHIFRTTTKKLSRIKFVCISPEVYVRVVEGTKIFSAPRILKTNCKLFMRANGKHKTKRDNSPG